MVQVEVADGILEGETVTDDIYGTFYSFKGIPYAEPPVGELRYKAPQPPKPWKGVRSAKEFGPQCYQYNAVTGKIDGGSEDCLYLNVYTPNLIPKDPLAVMIWIHGGAFCSGNSSDELFGPEYLIRHNVILVTFNYRLEVLGFLCLDTKDIPGNAGMKDQVAAMRWVKHNIAKFGGNPENITVFGQSAGGACVTYHCVSPMTKGLFNRAIVQSGTMTAVWAKSFRPRDRALMLAKKLGCTSEDDKEISEFFKSQPVEKLVRIRVPLTFAEKERRNYNITQMLPVSEKIFPNIEPYFTADIISALKNDIHENVQLVIGYNEHDGIMMVVLSGNVQEMVRQANDFFEYFVPAHIIEHCSAHDRIEVGKLFKSRYLQNKIATSNNLKPLCKYDTIDGFMFPTIQLAKFFSKKNKVYYYKFTCRSERNFFGKIFGVSQHYDEVLANHCDETAYLFPIKMINQQISKASDTFKMIRTMTTLWTNFAKTGNPTPDTSVGICWKPFRPGFQSYLEIGNRLIRKVSPDKEEVDLWEEVYRKYYPELLYREDEESNDKPDT